jgi:hypothetical protein
MEKKDLKLFQEHVTCLTVVHYWEQFEFFQRIYTARLNLKPETKTKSY